MNKGHFVHAAIPSELQRRRKTSQELSKLNKLADKPIGCNRNEHKFYTDMNDLRQKILNGTIPRSYGKKPKPSIMERLFPSFIKTKDFDCSSKQLAGGANFQPPLLPIASQNPPNNFFAGKTYHFKLPTPLPDNPEYLKAIDSKRTSALSTRNQSRIGRVSSLGSRQNSLLLFRQSSRLNSGDSRPTASAKLPPLSISEG